MFKYYILHLQTYSLTLYVLSSHIGGVMARVLVLSDVDRKLIRVITKLPNSEQSYKGKVKTHKYINRQNQSTTGKL